MLRCNWDQNIDGLFAGRVRVEGVHNNDWFALVVTNFLFFSRDVLRVLIDIDPIMAFLTNQRYEPYKEQTQNRASMSSRISRLFSRRRDDDGSAEQSVVTSSGCEVPIFMSTPAEAPQSSSRRPQFGEIGASWTEPAIIPEERRHTIPCSSVYSESPRPDHDHHEYEAEKDSPRSPACVHDLEEGSVIISTTSSQAPVLREKRRKARRPRESLRQRIAGKKRLSVAFGVTTLATVTTCKY